MQNWEAQGGDSRGTHEMFCYVTGRLASLYVSFFQLKKGGLRWAMEIRTTTRDTL